jgi:DNA helicase HerA-like ATPase
VKSAAETMRANPKIGDMATAITELAVGEALISFLDAKGRPSVTERVFVLPPGSQIGPITPDQRKALIATSLVAGTYEKVVDRESAYEKIKGRAAASPAQAPAGNGGAAAGPASAPQTQQMPTGITLPGQAPPAQDAGGGMMDMVKDMMLGTTGPRGGRKPGLMESAAQSAVKSIGSAVGREIIRGVLGSLLGGGRRR